MQTSRILQITNFELKPQNSYRPPKSHSNLKIYTDRQWETQTSRFTQTVNQNRNLQELVIRTVNDKNAEFEI